MADVKVYGALWGPDCRRARQLGAAIGEGITALLMARQYLQKHSHLATRKVNA